MKPGDLVTPKIVPNHGGKSLRIYDLPSIEIPTGGSTKFSDVKVPSVTEKLFLGQTAVIIEVNNEFDPPLVKVITPSGRIGWMKSHTLDIINGT